MRRFIGSYNIRGREFEFYLDAETALDANAWLEAIKSSARINAEWQFYMPLPPQSLWTRMRSAARVLIGRPEVFT